MIVATQQIDDRDYCELRAIASHEASHAVVALALGCTVEYASIEIDPFDRYGWGRIEHRHPPLTAEKYLAICCAGYVAEKLLVGRIVTDDSDDSSDHVQIVAKLAEVYPNGIPAAPREYRDGILLAMSIVKRHRRAVKRIADRLLVYHYLPGAAVRKLARLEGKRHVASR